MFVRAARLLTALLAFGLLLGTASPVAAAPATKSPSIVDVAIAANSAGPFAGQFDTLIAAVLAADPVVLNTLSGKGQFTVFAPTDAAFEALGLTPETVGSLPRGFLTEVLLYHVARGNREAAEVLASDRIRTLQGSSLRQSGGMLTDNLGRTATIIVTDITAPANGVIHAIDAVVLPKAP